MTDIEKKLIEEIRLLTLERDRARRWIGNGGHAGFCNTLIGGACDCKRSAALADEPREKP